MPWADRLRVRAASHADEWAQGMKDLEKAEAAIAASDWPRAITVLKRLAERKEAPASIDYNLAKALVLAGRAPQAGRWFERALAKDPAHASAWFEYGRWHLAAGDLAASHEAFAQAVALTPDDRDAHVNLARIAHRRGASDQALVAWRAVLHLAGLAGLQAITSDMLRDKADPEVFEAVLGCAAALRDGAQQIGIDLPDTSNRPEADLADHLLDAAWHASANRPADRAAVLKAMTHTRSGRIDLSIAARR